MTEPTGLPPAIGIAQVTISSWLTAAGLSYATAMDRVNFGRHWALSLRTDDPALEVHLVLMAVQTLYSTATLIEVDEGLNRAEMGALLVSRTPFVRLDPTEGSRCWIRTDFPVDPSPPHILVDTIRSGVEATLGGVVTLAKEFGARVKPIRTEIIPFRLIGEKELGASGDPGANPAAETPRSP